MGKQTRAAQKAWRENQPITPMTSYERANRMFKLVYGVEILERYTAEDSDAACETAVNTFAQTLYHKPNTNPLRRKYKTLEAFLNYFDTRYPKTKEETTNAY